MQKFLAIPVTDQQQQLVAIQNIVLVEQASTTTVTISYEGGQVVTLTHAAAGAGVETQRDAVEASIQSALIRPWNEPVYAIDGVRSRQSLPFAVSGVASAFNTASSDLSAQIAVSVDTVLTASQTGSTILLDAVGEDITLPAATSAWSFTFLATANVITSSWQILSAEGDNISGNLIVNGAQVTALAEDQINFIFNVALAGDKIEVICDGGGTIFVSGIGQAAGAITATDPA
jgi:hypothetical protein